MRTPLCGALVATMVLMGAMRSVAQPTPGPMTCRASNGRDVISVAARSGPIAKASTDAEGRATIEYDARESAGLVPQVRLFVYAHECGHHALGHDPHSSFTSSQETDADCFAIRTLETRFGFTANDAGLLQNAMHDAPPEVIRRLPWRPRPYDLPGCLPEEISRRQAARPAPFDINSCARTNDAQNAIVNESKDRLSIEAAYIVRNTCSRDVSCTFTIEVGTLPDTDADAGSWRNFHVQRRITEEHSIRSGERGAEFRIRAAIDVVRSGESIDFRVTVGTCR